MKNRAYQIALNCKDGYQRGLVSMLHNFFHKKLRSGAREVCKTGVNVNEVRAQQLHKRVIEKKKN